jgi:hypothetical protein
VSSKRRWFPQEKGRETKTDVLIGNRVVKEVEQRHDRDRLQQRDREKEAKHNPRSAVRAGQMAMAMAMAKEKAMVAAMGEAAMGEATWARVRRRGRGFRELEKLEHTEVFRGKTNDVIRDRIRRV